MSRTVRITLTALCAGVIGSATTAQLIRPVAAPTVRVDTVSVATVVSMPPVPVLLPPQGSLRLESGFGQSLAALADSMPRPIGSVAKTMTALVVLDAHPLRTTGDQGPMLTMTAADVDLYRAAIAADGSSLAVTAGERLSERDLLLALMLPSANNIAETLARWDGGTRERFVTALNTRARRLGMIATHFADPSGYDPGTVSSAADLVTLGRAALANPVLASIVATPSARLPDGTPLDNLDTLLTSEPGWLGLKTGETPVAGGCLLFAVRRTVPGGADPVTMVGAVLGQIDLTAALDAARSAVRTAFQGYTEVVWAAHPPAVDGVVVAAWGDTAGVRVGRARGTPSSPLRPEDHVTLRADMLPVSAPVAAATTVASVHSLVDGRDVASWDVETTGAINAAPVFWHIVHG